MVVVRDAIQMEKSMSNPFLRYGSSSKSRVRMLRLHLPMGRLFPLPLDVGILPWIVLRMVASFLSFTFQWFTRSLLPYDHGASSNIARGCGRFLLPTFVASLSIPCLTDDGHPLYVSGGSASFRLRTFRCPALFLLCLTVTETSKMKEEVVDSCWKLSFCCCSCHPYGSGLPLVLAEDVAN